MALQIGEKTLKVNRWNFKQACKHRGMGVYVYLPKNRKADMYNEWVNGNTDQFEEGEYVDVLPHEYINEYTLKKIGRAVPLEPGHWILEMPWDVEVCHGAVVTMPSGINENEYTPFRVAWLQNVPMYPVSFAVEIAPIYKTETIERPALQGRQELFTQLQRSEEDV